MHATLARTYRFEFEKKHQIIIWNFPVILQRTRLSVEVNYRMAAVIYLFGFISYGVERNYGGKKTVCYIRVFRMTFDLINRSSLKPFVEP